MLNILQIDTAGPIFEKLFKVRAPYIQAVNHQHLEQYGMYVTGDRQIDQSVASDWITTYLNIDQMVELFRSGTIIDVVQQSDCKVIYELISAHLEAWKNQLMYSMNIGNAPIEDLLLMDRFASAVYEHAKYHFTTDTVATILLKSQAKRFVITPGQFFRKGAEIPTGKLPDGGVTRINQDKFPPRDESLSDFLKDKLETFKRWR